MSDRSQEVLKMMQAELDKNSDPARLRVVYHADGNEDLYQVYLSREMEDKFTEFHIFANLCDPIKIPPYQEWWR
jgi:hypothetical protein